MYLTSIYAAGYKKCKNSLNLKTFMNEITGFQKIGNTTQSTLHTLYTSHYPNIKMGSDP